MHSLRILIAVVLLGAFSAAPAVRAEEVRVSAASPGDWDEERHQAILFAQDWIADLDAGDFAKAARPVLSYAEPPIVSVGGGPDSLPPERLRFLRAEMLRTMRAEMGEFSKRVLMGAVVYAAATDDSECKARVQYSTKASVKNVMEVVEVLLVKGREPAILGYRFEPYQEADIGLRLY